jgi:hypothetical protein
VNSLLALSIICSGLIFYLPVSADDDAIEASPVVLSRLRPVPPAVPSHLEAVPLSSSQVKLSWDDNSRNEDGFIVERANSRFRVSGKYEKVATVKKNVRTFEDNTALPGNTYLYRVRSFNDVGESGASDAVLVRVPK